MNATRLKQLIDETHKHGVVLKEQLLVLDKKGKGGSINARVKRSLLRGLERLNQRRWKELAVLERGSQFTMYDTITPSTGLPTRNPAAVAGYVNGKWPSYGGLAKRFPGAKHLSITVFASGDARCLDIETGDASASEAVAWVKRQHARGVERPVLYANTSTMPSVVVELERAGIPRSKYLLWTAHYTGVPHIEPGSDATQWRSVEVAGSNFDYSLCQPWFL